VFPLASDKKFRARYLPFHGFNTRCHPEVPSISTLVTWLPAGFLGWLSSLCQLPFVPNGGSAIKENSCLFLFSPGHLREVIPPGVPLLVFSSISFLFPLPTDSRFTFYGITAGLFFLILLSLLNR